MPDEPSGHKVFTDVLGLKPVADSLLKWNEAAIAGASAFLSRLCLPATEQAGLLLSDIVVDWRRANAARIVLDAEKKLEGRSPESPFHAHPRIVAGIIELGSWNDEMEVQEMWSGLLASACTPDGRDDSNLMFLDMLSKMSASQARIFDQSCKLVTKIVMRSGLIGANSLIVRMERALELSGLTDVHRLDRELDHLRSLGLFATMGGMDPATGEVTLSPTPLALQMYIRCHGHQSDPIVYFDLENSERRMPAVDHEPGTLGFAALEAANELVNQSKSTASTATV